jgi:ankyrin repeat protein
VGAAAGEDGLYSHGSDEVELRRFPQARRTAAGREHGEKAKEEYQAREEAARAGRDESFKLARQKKRSAIFAAARAGLWEQVKKGIWEDHVDADGVEVLTGLEEIIPKPEELKETLLHLAAKEGVIDVFKWLIDHGKSI